MIIRRRGVPSCPGLNNSFWPPLHRYDTIAEGIGLDRMTANFRRAHIDDAIYVDDQDAVRMAHFLLRNEGLLVGCSSAMNCVGAARLALELGPGHTIVTVLCDHGSRYMSRFWNKQFIADRGLEWPADEDLKPCNLQSWLCCAGRAGIAT
jgi:cysteine synthase A